MAEPAESQRQAARRGTTINRAAYLRRSHDAIAHYLALSFLSHDRGPRPYSWCAIPDGAHRVPRLSIQLARLAPMTLLVFDAPERSTY